MFRPKAVFFAALLCPVILSGSILQAPVETEDPSASNKAVRITVKRSSDMKVTPGTQPPAGQRFILLETRWENIHPKQKVEKKKLEGKADRTMGAGGLARGSKKDQSDEMVDLDVAYKVKKMFDHAYLVADGLAYTLHTLSGKVEGGLNPERSFQINRQGETREAGLVFAVPENAGHMVFHFFDYQYGHISIPIMGDPAKALSAEHIFQSGLGRIQNETMNISVGSLRFSPVYADKKAPEGKRYAVLELIGKSLSGGDIRDIVQFRPDQNLWLKTDGGYLYYCSESASAYRRNIRFIPEFYSRQEAAFLIPENATGLRMGLRNKNKTFRLPITPIEPDGPPEPLQSQPDGQILVVHFFGLRNEKGMTVLDLGITSTVEKGLTINASKQFILVTGDNEFSLSKRATRELAYAPPEPFIIPPGEAIRFEIAFESDGAASKLRFRGFRQEIELPLKDMEINHEK
jgi:hypothetical protein